MPLSFFTCSMSPMRMSREGFTDCPSHSTRPSSQAREAIERVLKNRAAQSHLSILMPVICLNWHTGEAGDGQCVGLRCDAELQPVVEIHRVALISGTHVDVD